MPSSAMIRFASLTDVGVKRSHNQDACAAQPAADIPAWQTHGHVFIVADGMGGHAVGEKASEKAIRDIPLTYLKHVVQEGPIDAIRRAFMEANAAIYAIGKNNPEFKGLGTTGTALFLRTDGAWIGHVGDSRAYRIRNGHVHQLTFDHSWVWEIARRQGLDPDQLGDYKRNVIIRSLGPDEDVEVDIEGPHPIEPGDVYLLCSDGLSNVVAADELGAVATEFPAEEACRYLVNLANLRGGPDNISCLIVQIPAEKSATPSRGRKPSRVWPFLKQLALGFNRLMPWPFLALSAGAVLAGLSIYFQANQHGSAAVSSFGMAALLILMGLIGLYFHLRSHVDPEDTNRADDPTVLQIYRDYTFTIDETFVERFKLLQTDLAETCKDRSIEIDQQAIDTLIHEAELAAKQNDWRTAFRQRFVALQLLATAFHKARQKDEVFQPNWTINRLI